jgi:hypothetical protein
MVHEKPPPSRTPSSSKAHVPGAAVVELQTALPGQPLPPSPRQPSTQVREASSQMRPEVTSPQSASEPHAPQAPIEPSSEEHFCPSGQLFPSEPRQPSLHVPSSQTRPDVASPHSESASHSTQRPMVSSVDVHRRPSGQPLPPVPRQPSRQSFWRVSQTLPLVGPPQSASDSHVAHTPVSEHTFVRQSPSPRQGSPSGRPHLLSAGKHRSERHKASVGGGPQSAPFTSPHRSSASSHTPEAQTRAPFAGVQSPFTGATFGIGSPFLVLGTHTPPAHHLVAGHSLSSLQASPQMPIAIWHSLSGGVHSALSPHFPHSPVPRQCGSAKLGQGRVAEEPCSPLQAPQVFVVVSHEGVMPAHAVAFVPEHSPQAPVERHAGAAAVGHGRMAPEPWSPVQGAQSPVATLQVGVVPEHELDVGVQPIHSPLAQIGLLGGQAAGVPLPALPSHCTQAPPMHTGNAPEQSPEVVQGKHAVLPPGGFGQLLPLFTIVPRHVQGLTVVSAPQASPGFSVKQVPSTSPVTFP